MYLKRLFFLSVLTFSFVPSLTMAIGSGPYLGFQAGSSNLDAETRTFTGGSPPQTFRITPSNSGFAARLYGGYGINQYVAWEGGYTYYSPASYDLPFQCSEPTIRLHTLDIVGKVMFPFGEIFDVFAKAGGAIAYSTKSDSLLENTAACSTDKTNNTSVRPTAAIGASYYLSQNWVADVTASRFFGSGNVPSSNFYALGISYHFVDKYCGQFLC